MRSPKQQRIAQLRLRDFRFCPETVDSLVRQIRKHKTRLEKKLHGGGFDQFADAEPVMEELDFNIVRFKTVSMKPQDIEEAILQMNMLNHQFYMFLNSSTEKINVVYLRKDGGYGVIEPESV